MKQAIVTGTKLYQRKNVKTKSKTRK